MRILLESPPQVLQCLQPCAAMQTLVTFLMFHLSQLRPVVKDQVGIQNLADINQPFLCNDSHFTKQILATLQRNLFSFYLETFFLFMVTKVVSFIFFSGPKMDFFGFSHNLLAINVCIASLPNSYA